MVLQNLSTKDRIQPPPHIVLNAYIVLNAISTDLTTNDGDFSDLTMKNWDCSNYKVGFKQRWMRNFVVAKLIWQEKTTRNGQHVSVVSVLDLE